MFNRPFPRIRVQFIRQYVVAGYIIMLRENRRGECKSLHVVWSERNISA